ncbi:carbohydrate ABC transporter substrate-binding protein (CUT1 family) [Pseudonocardia kunmingensis]|uniref:Carbohydrate ABC transporter substrate-binding protein (CUT1 family) n=1 Tax=Pseudonocardia kunmingensis TaxID=630975 RepID=A0A543DQN5_9PSEU|nr:carbohydrate ABC transporter substrate-binding protein (CUT1 family) [Pseudonocardia kunmingensis]
MALRGRTAAFIGVSAALVLGVVGTIASAVVSGHDSARTVTWWLPNWDTPIATELVAQFEAENPDLTVRMVETTVDTIANKVSVALDSGDTPDVITELASRTRTYVRENQLADLSDLFGPQMPREDFISGALDAVSSGGAVHAVPYRWDCIALIYNKDLLAGAGITGPPTTWADFAADAKAVTAGDVAGVAWPMGGTPNDLVNRFLGFALSAGATVEDGVPRLTTESSRAALEVVASSVADGWASRSSLEVDNTEVRELFINGRVGMYVGGVFDVQLQLDAGMNVGTAVTPGPAGPGMQGADGWGYVVPAEAPNTEGAKRLVAFLSRPANMARLTSTYPARISAADDPRFHDEYRQAHYEQLTEHSVPTPNDPAWVSMIPSVAGTIQSVALGESTPDEGARAIQAEADRVLGPAGAGGGR